MSCVEPEVLSRWVDGSLGRAEARSVARHVLLCAPCRAKADELRGAAEWIARATEPGSACLSAEEIASVLDGAEAPPHAATCPRCAAEIAAFRPPKRATRRLTIRRGEGAGAAWFAAAAAVALAVIGLVFLAQQRPSPNVVRAPEPAPAPELPPEPPVRPSPPIEIPRPLDLPVPVQPPPDPVPAPKPPAPAPVKPEPKVEPPVPAPKPPEPLPAPKPTIADAPARKALALAVRSGAVSALAEGKWAPVARVEEGMPLRAEGRTSIDFAKARLTFDGASRFTLGKDEVALSEGALSLDVPQGSALSLVIGPCRVVPRASAGRVLLSARPDRVVVDEGGARWKEIVLHQGEEHHLKTGKLEPQKRRSLPAALRPRETPAWKPNFKDAAVRTRIRGRIDALPEGIQVVSVPLEGNPYFAAQASFTAKDERGFFAAKPASALRFRYFLSDPAILQLVVHNGTKRENFNLDLDPVVRRWTTVTVFLKDVPVNQGGDRTLEFDPGDRVWSVGWFVGTPGSTATITVDSVEIVEIDR